MSAPFGCGVGLLVHWGYRPASHPGLRFFAHAGAACAVSQTIRFMLWDGRLPFPDHDWWSSNGGGYDV